MDEQLERAKLGGLIAMIVVFAISAYLSVVDLTYLTCGSTADATITRTYRTETPGRRRPKARTVVEYTFTDHQGQEISGRDLKSRHWQIPADGAKVQYLAHVPRSHRIQGELNWLAFVLFGGSLLFIAWGVYWLHQEAHRTPGKRRSTKRSSF